jgi:hypothetical protein
VKSDALALAPVDGAPPVQLPEFALTLARLAALDAEQADLARWVAAAPEGALITGPEAALAAETWAKRCAIVAKATAAELKRNVEPINAAKDLVTEAFKPRIDAAKALKTRLGQELASYQIRKRDAAAALLQASAEAHLQGDHVRAASTLAAMSELRPNDKPEGLTFKRVWRARVTAPELVPREYCVPSESMLNKSVKDVPDDTEPPPVAGVEFYLETSTTVRT